MDKSSIHISSDNVTEFKLAENISDIDSNREDSEGNKY